MGRLAKSYFLAVGAALCAALALASASTAATLPPASAPAVASQGGPVAGNDCASLKKKARRSKRGSAKRRRYVRRYRRCLARRRVPNPAAGAGPVDSSSACGDATRRADLLALDLPQPQRLPLRRRLPAWLRAELHARRASHASTPATTITSSPRPARSLRRSTCSSASGTAPTASSASAAEPPTWQQARTPDSPLRLTQSLTWRPTPQIWIPPSSRRMSRPRSRPGSGPKRPSGCPRWRPIPTRRTGRVRSRRAACGLRSSAIATGSRTRKASGG